MASPPPSEPATPFALRQWLRWGWGQLTSMSTALLLLFALALAAVPGSLFPQRGASPLAVNEWLERNPQLGAVLDRLGMFDVFASAWFTAVYLLLLISIAGCVLPRLRVHLRALRTGPPPVPAQLDRLPCYVRHRPALDSAAGSAMAPAPGPAVIERAAGYLRGQRWRVQLSADGQGLSAEKGYARETGNLVFHAALLVLIVAVAAGALFGYRGQIIVREGRGFANTLTQYDLFNQGRLVRAGDLPPLSFTLEDFTAVFEREGTQRGSPRAFIADVLLRRTPASAPEPVRIEVNRPLRVGGTSVYLTGHGYAPVLAVRQVDGRLLHADATVFLPQDPVFTSTGVVKMPDAQPGLGLQGVLLPSAQFGAAGPVSVFPAADNPVLFLTAWEGDLGMDEGAPQNVYALDFTNLTQIGSTALRPGQVWTLPDGRTVAFVGLSQFASFQVADEPAAGWALAAAVVAMIGLLAGLFVRRRRIWLRLTPDGWEAGALSRTDAPGLADDLTALTAAVLGGNRQHRHPLEG